jgi:hypothetical protein
MQHIIDCVKDALGFTIIQRSVRTRYPQKCPFGGEECVRRCVIELMTIIAQDMFDGAAKLHGDISEKI